MQIVTVLVLAILAAFLALIMLIFTVVGLNGDLDGNHPYVLQIYIVSEIYWESSLTLAQ